MVEIFLTNLLLCGIITIQEFFLFLLKGVKKKMENKIIEDFVEFVEKLYKETNIHPTRIEYIIKSFLEHCPTGSH